MNLETGRCCDFKLTQLVPDERPSSEIVLTPIVISEIIDSKHDDGVKGSLAPRYARWQSSAKGCAFVGCTGSELEFATTR